MKSSAEHEKEIWDEWDKLWKSVCPEVLVTLMEKQETGQKVTVEDLYQHFFNTFVGGQVAVLGKQVARMEQNLRDRGLEPNYPEFLRGPSTDGGMDDFAVDRHISPDKPTCEDTA
jgi:hypothetical protein